MLLSGGGTGGHVYPALAVLDALARPRSEVRGPRSGCGTSDLGLRSSDTGLRALWVGGRRGIEAELVTRAGLPFEGIEAAGVRGMAPRGLASNLLRLARGFLQARRIVQRFRPDVILVTGGYVSVPVALAGRLAGVPILILLPDVVPGLAIRFLARLADRVAASFEAARRYLPADKVVVTGYPVRAALYTADRDVARQRLGLGSKRKTVLIFGGSSGARRINEATAAVLEELLDLAQVVHISGRLDFEALQERRAALPSTLKNRYRLHAYLHDEMLDALVAADLAVSRAGAATLGEFPAVGLPAVLVPYPYAGAHQRENAAILAEAGAAVVIPDAELTGERLLATVQELFNDAERLAQMRANARRLAQPEAAWRVAENLQSLVSGLQSLETRD